MNKDEDTRGYEDEWSLDEERHSEDHFAPEDQFIEWSELYGMK